MSNTPANAILGITYVEIDGISHVVFVWRTVRTTSLLSAQHLCCRTTATTVFDCKDYGRQHSLTARTAADSTTGVF